MPAHSGDDTAEDEPEPRDFDVLVIGSGPAGLSAAWEARDHGASVVVLELADVAGGNGLHASNFLAAGTQAQAMLGIDDSPEAALGEWEMFTGGDASDPSVVDFMEGSADLVTWLADLGAVVQTVFADFEAGGVVPRVHTIMTRDHKPPGELLVGELDDEIRLLTRAEDLVVEDGRVVGASYTDLVTGQTGRLYAGATVVATGGFARNVERMLADRPELEGMGLVAEAGPTTTGAGHHLLEDVGAARQNEGNYGVYLHALADYREGFGGEALWITNIERGLVLTPAGRRVTSQEQLASFGLSHEVAGSWLWVLYPQQLWSSTTITVPSYNWAAPNSPEMWFLGDLVPAGAARHVETLADLQAALAIDGDTLQAAIDDHNDQVELGEGMEVRVELPVLVVRLSPAAAKAFTGTRLDAQGRVLNEAGQAIPGLYAAGEVAGVLGTDAVGTGFTGSVSACYWSGLRAGVAAADYAQE